MGYISDTIRQAKGEAMITALTQKNTKNLAAFGVKLADLEMQRNWELMLASAAGLANPQGDLDSGALSSIREGELLATARDAYEAYGKARIDRQQALDLYNAANAAYDYNANA